MTAWDKVISLQLGVARLTIHTLDNEGKFLYSYSGIITNKVLTAHFISK